jgi:D-alanyl-lipoteichoic acid acyltransferase DltB (MBOAT superfamily)
MFFNSLSFAVFLPIVFVLYWFVFNKSKASQNAVLIVASYYFYSCWDWRFLFLLVFSTFLDYYTGKKILVLVEYYRESRISWCIQILQFFC